jgi:hypothetical protein
MQFGFSTDTTDKWFAEKSARHYLLGFSYNEGHVFATDVVRKVRPQARVYVINLDGFFAPYASPIVKTLTNDDSAQQDYRNKRTWQWAHRSLCGRLPVLCGSEFTVFRVKPTGRWIAEGKFELQTQPTSENPAIDEEALKEQTALGHFFLDRVTARRECIILTMVPTVQTTQATAKAIAAAVNLELVSPTLDDLRTFDGSHLDKESAERWSAAFLEAAGPRIQKCLTEPQFSSGLNLDHPQP